MRGKKHVVSLKTAAIEKFSRLTPEVIAAAASARGLATAQFGPSTCCIRSGALYAYHREALAALLQANADTLRASGLPVEPNDFVACIAVVWFEENHPVRPIIATAFGERA